MSKILPLYLFKAACDLISEMRSKGERNFTNINFVRIHTKIAEFNYALYIILMTPHTFRTQI